MISPKQSKKPWPPSNNSLAAIALVVSAIGFFDATYLAIIHFSGQTPDCSLIHGCEAVTTSQYSQVLGVPVALFGAIFYITLFFLLLSYLDTKNKKYLYYASLITPLGFIASVWFIFAMAVLIKAFCQFCLLSAFTSTSLFLLLFPITKNAFRIVVWTTLRKQKL